MRRRTHAVLDAAWAGGVRYFDAARSYGRAEEFLASWLASRGISPGELAVGSKWGYRYTAGWRTQAEVHEVKDHSVTALREQLAESRNHLGPYLTLYQIHSATLESGVLDDAAVLDELARLRDSGMRVGLSLSGPGQAATLARAMTVERGGRRLFESVQATWNLLEPSVGKALTDASSSGISIIAKEVLANGQLTSRADASWYPDAKRTLAREAERLGTSVDALAIAAALAQPWADRVLSGAVAVDQVKANLAAQSLHIPSDLLDRLRSVAVSPAEYWKRRAGSVWS